MIVSVVGHGPSCKGFGRDIDSSDVVVRMFDCDWQPAEDHGTKYDIGLLRDTRLRWNEAEELEKEKRLRIPSRKWWLYRHATIKAINNFRERPVEVIPARSLAKMIAGRAHDGFKVTRGGSAILWAIATLKASEVRTWGFDNLAAEMTTGGYHPDCGTPVFPMGERRNRYHDYRLERLAIIHAAKNYGTTIFHNGAPL